MSRGRRGGDGRRASPIWGDGRGRRVGVVGGDVGGVVDEGNLVTSDKERTGGAIA